MITVYHLNFNLARWSEKFTLLIATISAIPREELIQKCIVLGLYKKVAEVNKDNLDDAYRLTNSIDNYWGDNLEVKEFGERNKSSAVGDLLLKDGELYVVEMMGFTKLSSQVLELLEPNLIIKNKKPKI